ncbi:hypothetical protein MMC15_003188 [Xylographa vitiligo]|nr:hypothetical protein [Xylographa vitiligo]
MPPTRRVPACTHLSMTRLYGCQVCNHCSQPSRLGWVYSCAQDNICDTSVAIKDLADLMAATTIDQQAEPHPSLSKQEIVDHRPVELSPWIEKAIIDGHYTADQIDILRAQKRRVQSVIASVQSEFLSARPATLMPSRMASQRNSTIVKEPNQPCGNTQVSPDKPKTNEPLLVKVADGIAVSPPPPPPPPPRPPPTLISECNYKTCQVCRPISRDRAWQCFDHVFHSNTQCFSPDFASDLRPVSDARHVRRLGLWKPRPRPRTFTSFDNIVLTDEEDESETDTSLEDSQSRRDSRDSTSAGFRASARRAFHEMMTVSRQQSIRNRDSKDSSTSTLNAAAKKHKGDHTPTKWTEGQEYRVFGDGDTRLSRYARQQKLWRKDGRLFGDSPARRNSFFKATPRRAESATKSEMRVENGVAVTEEAIDLGSADIIIQA